MIYVRMTVTFHHQTASVSLPVWNNLPLNRLCHILDTVACVPEPEWHHHQLLHPAGTESVLFFQVRVWKAAGSMEDVSDGFKITPTAHKSHVQK